MEMEGDTCEHVEKKPGVSPDGNIISDVPLQEAEIQLVEGNVPMEKLVGCHVMENILEVNPLLDTVISCRDGRIGAHRAVLVSASPFIGYLLSKRVPGEVATIVLPDIDMEIMTVVLTLCYTGQMLLSSKIEDDVYAAMEMLMIGDQAKFTVIPVKQEEAEDVLVNEVETATEPPPEDPPPQDETIETIVPDVIPPIEKEGPKPKSKKGRERKKSNKSKKIEDFAKIAKSIITLKEVKVEENLIELRTQEEEPPPTELQEIKIKYPAAGIMLLDGKSYVCAACDGIIGSKSGFIQHLIHAHGKAFKTEIVEHNDAMKLKTCNFCSETYSSLAETTLCLKSHGYIKCYACFALVNSQELASHYRSIHGIRTAFALVSKCRWCDLGIAIGKNALKPQNHAVSEHINVIECYSDVDDDNSCEKSSPQNGTKPPIGRSGGDIGSSPAAKRRKLDQHGKPLQLSKRTGVLANKFKKILLPNMEFITQPPELFTDPESGKLKQFSISSLLKSHVHLETLSNNLNLETLSNNLNKEVTSIQKNATSIDTTSLKNELLTALLQNKNETNLATYLDDKSGLLQTVKPIYTNTGQEVAASPSSSSLNDSFGSSVTISRASSESEPGPSEPRIFGLDIVQVIETTSTGNAYNDKFENDGDNTLVEEDWENARLSFFRESVSAVVVEHYHQESMNIDNLSNTSDEEEF